eukprot:4662744-Pyramimonas_sp.AAC.1
MLLSVERAFEVLLLEVRGAFEILLLEVRGSRVEVLLSVLALRGTRGGRRKPMEASGGLDGASLW